MPHRQTETERVEAPRLRLVTAAVAAVPAARRPNVLGMWHLLSLDAPTVATVWTMFVGRCAHVALPWTDAAAMFVAVWLLYAADRLLDARPLDAARAAPLDAAGFGGGLPYGLEERHRFHHRHRRVLLTVAAPATAALAALLLRTEAAELRLYTLLAALLGGWLLLVHARPQASAASHRLPKELATGVFFAAAVCIPTVARAPWLRPQLLAVAALFGALCLLNCVFVYAWEHPLDEREAAHATTRWAAARVRLLAIVCCAGGMSAVGLATRSGDANAMLLTPGLATTASALVLLWLDARLVRVGRVTLRAAADAALLTPLALWWLAGR